MDQQSIIADMDRRARTAGVSMGEVCDAAGVARSTFYRWKRTSENPDPISATLTSLNKLEDALSKIEGQTPCVMDRVIICDVCEQRVDGAIPNACTFVDCPHAQRIAA
jgi:hypothetical protein